MPADPQHPGSPGGVSRPGRWTDWDRQEEVLAEELAAFPAEDQPDWLALEDAEYSGDEVFPKGSQQRLAQLGAGQGAKSDQR